MRHQLLRKYVSSQMSMKYSKMLRIDMFVLFKVNHLK
ncbi:unnamed protein product [Trichobilharzia regenti]|nr:unnamed protein product [Trichobilharzia regenti]